MDRYIFRQPTEADIEYIAANIRQADRDEVLAASGRSHIADVIKESVAASPLCVTVEKDGRALCIGGAAYRSLLSSVGVPWMLGADELSLEGRLFMAHGRRCVDALLVRFAYLENYVDARNHKSIRWLKRMGFAVHKAEPYGVYGMPFHRFSVGRRDV